MASIQPLIDGDNPCYCPNISPSAYLTMLRQALQSSSNPFHHFTMHSPFWKLGAGVFKEGVRKPDETPQDTASSSPFPSSPLASRNVPSSIKLSDFERNQIPDDLAGAPVLTCGPVGPAWQYIHLATSKRPIFTTSYLARAHTVVKRSRYSSTVPAGSFSDRDPHNRLSFGKNDELEKFSIDRRALHLVEPLPTASSQQPLLTTQAVLAQLDDIFPGLGFRHALTGMGILDPEKTEEYKHQAIADYLAEKGLLNERVLDLLSRTKLHCLELGPTLCDENGLNLQQSSILHVVSMPGRFKDLTELSFNGGRFQRDFELVHIQSLRQLKKLSFEATGVGNEAVFLLVSLKENLETLHLSFNLKIDDDAIPAIILLKELEFLSIYGTSIGMPGLRKLTQTIIEEGRTPAVEIPEACEKYIDSLDKQYLRYPESPLVVDPSVCSTLSESALKRNLKAHASVNPSVIASGTREEMVERLMKILEMRKLDHLVCSLFTDRTESESV